MTVQPVQSSCACGARQAERDEGYQDLERVIAERVANAKGPLFTTNAKDLCKVYLGWLPSERRQHYNCRTCERFIENYGRLGTIDESGHVASLLWDPYGAPEFFRLALAAMKRQVEDARVTGVFLSGVAEWGKAQTGGWSHLCGVHTEPFKHTLKTAEQAMAEKREEYLMLRRGLADYPVEAVRQAVRVLDADALDRSEKTLGVARWLLDLHGVIARNSMRKENLIWRAVATAPPGWCHVRSTMIHTLLDDIVRGLPFSSISRRWAEKMHPLQYQRPTAPPSDGAIQQAEKIVEKLQAAGALKRRFARLSDVKHLWLPRKAAGPPAHQDGVFGHLKQQPAQVRQVELPEQKISWAKFVFRLFDALEVEVYLTGDRQQFYGLVTAEDPDAPPILQWDGLEGHPRNPVSWYFYHQGSSAGQWGLCPGWHPVSCIFLKPPMWHEPEKMRHHGEGAFFAIPGCKDQARIGPGAIPGGSFFPENLRSEYHGVRKVMEAYSAKAVLAGAGEGDANGIAFEGVEGQSLLVRVRTKEGLATYRIESWD